MINNIDPLTYHTVKVDDSESIRALTGCHEKVSDHAEAAGIIIRVLRQEVTNEILFILNASGKDVSVRGSIYIDNLNDLCRMMMKVLTIESICAVDSYMYLAKLLPKLHRMDRTFAIHRSGDMHRTFYDGY